MPNTTPEQIEAFRLGLHYAQTVTEQPAAEFTDDMIRQVIEANR